MMMGDVLVTGGTGAVGPAVVRALQAQGRSVSVLSRRPEYARALLPAAAVHFGDVQSAAALREAVAGARVLFHLAARVPGSGGADYRQDNIAGTGSVVRAAAAAGVERIVLFSTINVYGASGPTGMLTEATPLRPDSPYAESKAAAEEIARSECGDCELVILRLAAVYGPGMQGNYRRLVRALARGWFMRIGDGSARRTLVHEDDVARAAMVAGWHPVVAGGVFNVTDGGVHTVAELVTETARALHRPIPRLGLPAAPVRVGARLVEALCLAAGVNPPITPGGVDAITRHLAVSGERLQAATAYRPLVDFKHGWRQTVAVITGNSGMS